MSPASTHLHQLKIPDPLLHFSVVNATKSKEIIDLIQPYIFEPETNSEELKEE